MLVTYCGVEVCRVKAKHRDVAKGERRDTTKVSGDKTKSDKDGAARRCTSAKRWWMTYGRSA